MVNGSAKPTEAYPLTWPAGWRRTDPYRRTDAKFRKGQGGWRGEGAEARYQAAARVDLGEALNRVYRELRAFGAQDVIVSSDLRLRNDGLPYSQQATSGLDPGVAVYWRDGKKDRCMAIDRYNRIADNLAAIAATLDAMRAIERHGGALILDRAFTGFTALPQPEQWFQVLGVKSTASRDEIDSAYRTLAMQHHPDRGGDSSQMARINTARDVALEQISGGV